MNSAAVKILLALSLAISLCACNNSNTTSNNASPNNSTNSNTATGSATSTTGETPKQKSAFPTLEEVQKELEARKLGKGLNTPKPTPKQPVTSQAPPTIEITQDRALVRYYLYLVTRLGLPFNQPLEMPGGASLFSADDIIQFTMAEPKVAVVAAKFTDADKQIKGTDVLNKLNVEGRKVVTEGNYVIMVKGADENLLKVLAKSLKDFPKQP